MARSYSGTSKRGRLNLAGMVVEELVFMPKSERVSRSEPGGSCIPGRKSSLGDFNCREIAVRN